jgi:cell division initiation protein
MRLSPLDIRQQQFTVRLFRGLDPQEVDTFLEDVAEDYETVLKENALLKEQLAALEERSRGLTDREKQLQDTLVTTQKLTEEMKDSARREGQIIVREAELRGEKVLDEARTEEARIRTEIKSLKRTHRHLVEELRATVDRYGRLLEADVADVEPDGSRAE